MKNIRNSSGGSLHPVLFAGFLYIVVLFLSIFICSSVFYSCNAGDKNTSDLVTNTSGTQPQPR